LGGLDVDIALGAAAVVVIGHLARLLDERWPSQTVEVMVDGRPNEVRNITILPLAKKPPHYALLAKEGRYVNLLAGCALHSAFRLPLVYQ
jgi:hypothetical protein